MRELEKISALHKRGKFDIPEKDFLELVLCPYEGNGIMDKKPLKKFLREREELDKVLPQQKVNLKLAVDRAKYTQVTGIEDEADRKIKAHVNNKLRKEDEEKMRKEQERKDILKYSSLANSLLNEIGKRKYGSNLADDESLMGPNRRKTTQFAHEAEMLQSISLHEDEQEEDEYGDDEDGEAEEDRGPRFQRDQSRRIQLPIDSSED